MSSETLLLISVVASLVTSAVMWQWLRISLRTMLGQLCDRPGSTDFWSRYTLLMLVIAPLVIAIFFSPEATRGTVDAIRRILLAILLGNFVGFVLVGRSLYKAVGRALDRESTTQTGTKG